MLNSPHCSSNTPKFFPLEGEGGKSHPRRKTQWCLGRNKTPRLVSASLLQVLYCFENGVTFVAWWFLGTFPELTSALLKAPQVTVGISESRAPNLMNPTGNSQLRRCGRLGLEEQVGVVLALASREGPGSPQQITNGTFHNACFSLRLWLTYHISLLVSSFLMCLSVYKWAHISCSIIFLMWHCTKAYFSAMKKKTLVGVTECQSSAGQKGCSKGWWELPSLQTLTKQCGVILPSHLWRASNWDQ